MRILFITSTYLGDAILSTGILNNLQETFPEAKFYIACGPVPASLFDPLPGRSKTYVIRKKPFSFHWLELWIKCVFKPWHLVVDVRGTALSYALFTKHRKIWRSCPEPILRVHQLAKWMGLQKTPLNKVWTTLKNEKEADRLLPPGSSYIAFSPTANWIKKCWPLESFVQLGKILLQDKKMFPKGKIVVLGTAEQRTQIDYLFQSFKPEEIIDLMGKPSLPTLSVCLSRCKLFVGNDSGLMHLAATSNTNTVGIFGPSPSHIYGPWGKHTAFVSLKESQEALSLRIKKAENVMDDISVESVLKAIYDVLENK